MTDVGRDTLRSRWDERYRTFSLDESGCLGAGDRPNRLIYRVKKQALRRLLGSAGFDARRHFRVLDMGCGFGYFAAFYHAEFPAASYTGVDISTRAIDRAKEMLPAGEFYADDIVSWRHPTNVRFDVVQAIEVLQLIVDDGAFEAALGNFERHLADGGVILLPMAFSERKSANEHQRFRPRPYFDRLIETLGLEVVAEKRLYYWLIDGGPTGRIARAIFSRLGPGLLYLVDRIAVAFGIQNHRPNHQLSTAHMLLIRRRQVVGGAAR